MIPSLRTFCVVQFNKFNDGDYMSFRLTSQKIMIYGAASIGAIMYDNFKKIDIPVYAFIDKRGGEIEQCCGLQVLSLEELKKADRQTLIVLGVKNVFEHAQIAQLLFDMGFRKLIFRPYTVIKGHGNETEVLLNEIYDKIMIGDDSVKNANIPFTDSINVVDYSNKSVIQSDNESMVVNVPIEFVYTENGLKIGKENNFWSDIPILALISHIDFFRWADQQPGCFPNMYMDFCMGAAKHGDHKIKITNAWKANVLRNRIDVYENMNNSLQRDFSFFIDNAVKAVYTSSDHFELKSGKHRASFFVAKNRRYLPLRLTLRDYEKWLETNDYNKIIADFKSKGIIRARSALEYPFLYEMPSDDANGYFRLLGNIVHTLTMGWLGSSDFTRFSETHVLLSLDDDGYIGRNLRRYGVKVYGNNKSDVSLILEQTMKEPLRDAKKRDNFDLAVIDTEYDENTVCSLLGKRSAKEIIALTPDDGSDVKLEKYRLLIGHGFDVSEFMLRGRKFKLLYICV